MSAYDIRRQRHIWTYPNLVVRPNEPYFKNGTYTSYAAVLAFACAHTTIKGESIQVTFLEFEIVHRDLIAARELVIQRESELVPVGKRATDVYIEEQMRGMIVDEDGKGYKPNPAYTIDQERIDVAEAEKAGCEDRLDAAKRAVEDLLGNAKMRAQSVGAPVAGTRLVFVDLAGAEYSTTGSTTGTGSVAAAPQTSLERQEGRQINTDLLALKEVIRARASRQSRIPYRNSPLTMVLKEHFEHELAPQDTSFMILNVAEASAQLTATVNTLQFGSLVGVVAG
ncbi:P-loop containing nucleoside triphosphate hydrolase protein [Ceraceosorus guamensis]|uniref:P-loop containing nucleoside triphosphate hydrolase protein n=1 Tax=Ceraceosorus guamensis TaxID=1522189 RepID=A0A316VN50_9BASI|nr:P-loop containing nucleoside triphosphate hydrolase protein [Ceraceosorus guamensis]PWN38987.1 P-loop containing nucleoside triphosphate hydrolase protein [Ceraceosorus guamensis]